MIYLVPFLSTVALQLLVLRRLRFDWVVVTIVLAGLLLDTNYLAYTSIFQRNYDGPSHVLYIDEIAEHLRLPPVNVFCTACGHPPLYYALGALWSKTVLAGGWFPRELGLQWLSLMLFCGFVCFALLLLRSTIERPATLRLAAALVVFWPSGVLNSVRAHNDALAAPLIIAAMYFIVQWDRQGRQRAFSLAALACALAVLTKATGYAMAATLFLIAALHLPRFGREGIKRLVAVTLVLVCAALLATSFREGVGQRTVCRKVLGRACDVPPEIFTDNKPINYLYFDLPGYLGSTNPTAQPPRQDYFINGLAKSSLFGTMPLGKEFEGAYHKVLAVIISLLLLAMVILCMATLPFVRSVIWLKYRAIAMSSGALLILLTAFRIILPTPFHEDFRHIFPIVVPFCLLYAKAVERLRAWSVWLHRTGIGIGLLMIASSVAFFARIP